MWLIVTVVLAVLSLRGSRWAYVAYMLFATLFIPARAGFQIQPLVCETPGGNCRMRDLVPDTAGAIFGAAIGWAWRTFPRER